MGLGLSSATTLLSALSLVTLLSRPGFLRLLHRAFVALWYILRYPKDKLYSCLNMFPSAGLTLS